MVGAAAHQIVDFLVESVESAAAAEWSDAVDRAEDVPVPERVADGMGITTGNAPRPVADLDASNPDPGPYYDEDYSTWTVVQRCASDPMDEDSVGRIGFPADDDGKLTLLASVEFTMMQNGTVAIATSDVTGFALDSNNDWIAD